jgi:hypothetical protein
MRRSATVVTLDQPPQTPTAHADAPETGAHKRERRLLWLAVAAGVLITAAWGLALVFFAWSLLAVVL